MCRKSARCCPILLSPCFRWRRRRQNLHAMHPCNSAEPRATCGHLICGLLVETNEIGVANPGKIQNPGKFSITQSYKYLLPFPSTSFGAVLAQPYSCLCCCWPIGLYAVITSSSVEENWRRGAFDVRPGARFVLSPPNPHQKAKNHTSW